MLLFRVKKQAACLTPIVHMDYHQTWNMSINLYEHIFFQSQSLRSKLAICAKMKRKKTANNANNTIFISIATLFPLWYLEVITF